MLVKMRESGVCGGMKGSVFYKVGEVLNLDERALLSLPKSAYILLETPEQEEKKATKKVKKASNKQLTEAENK